MTLMINLLDFGSGFFSIFTTKFKRVKTYSLAMIANFVSMLGIAVCLQTNQGILALVFVCTFSSSFSIGNGSMLNVYTSEFLCVSGSGYAVAARWLTSTLITFVVPSVRSAVGILGIFYISAGFSLLHILMLLTIGVETLGKNKHTIEEEFSGMKDETATQGASGNFKRRSRRNSHKKLH